MAEHYICIPKHDNPDQFTGERYVPGKAVSPEMKAEHLHRYVWAAQMCDKIEVVDIACGEGYGSWILSQVAKRVVGVDIDSASIQSAKERYPRPNLLFWQGACQDIPAPDHSADTVVSFETLEHVEHQERFLEEVTRVLRPEGTLIISTPFKAVYNRTRDQQNPFHVKELDPEEFFRLLECSFKHIQLLGQACLHGSMVLPFDGRSAAPNVTDGRVAPADHPLLFFNHDSHGNLHCSQEGIFDPVYLIAVATNASERPTVPVSVFESELSRTVVSALQGGIAERDAQLRHLQGQLPKQGELRELSARLLRLEQTVEAEISRTRAIDAELNTIDAELNARLTAGEKAVEGLGSQLARLDRCTWALLAQAQRQNRRSRRMRSPVTTAARLAAATFRPVDTARLRRHTREIQHSGCFDESYYLSQHPDVAVSGVDPLWHFMQIGWKEGRNPSAGFNTTYYLRQYPDVSALGTNPLVHYVRHGRKEGRRPVGPTALGRLGPSGILRAAHGAGQRGAPSAKSVLEITPAPAPTRLESCITGRFRYSTIWPRSLAGRALNGLESWLETLGIHSPVQRMARRFLPHAVRRFIRNLRPSHRLTYRRRPNETREDTHAETLPPDPIQLEARWHVRKLDERAVWAAVLSGLEFPRVETPDASIVIPVHNKIAFTHLCLVSLRENLSGSAACEVIVVDDRSTDGTQEMLKQIAGITVLRNEQNLGFVGSCNRGAAAARGKYIVFLNNDTIVLPGWLEELLKTFEWIPQTGLAGSMLLYPDGTLQEAGGIMWRDGSGWNYGRGDRPDQAKYLFARDVDYCSGASLVIPRVLFEELGGFGEEYSPGYYEDTDLAFRVREAGWRTVYQPFSRLVHFEGASAGTNTRAGMKRFQVVNRKTFLARWGHAIAEWKLPDEAKSYFLDRRSNRHALVIDATTPMPDRDSGSNDTLIHMQFLQDAGFRVSFAPGDNMMWMGRYTEALQQRGIECLYAPDVSDLVDHLKAEGWRYDVIWVYRWSVLDRYLKAIRAYAPRAKIVFDTVDLHYLRQQRQAEIASDSNALKEAVRVRDRELGLMAEADHSIVISDFEKSLLRSKGIEKDVSVIPMCREIPGREGGFVDRSPEVVFVGGFRHEPNVDAVRYFVQEIWPLVRKRVPDAQFVVVGSGAHEHLADLQVEGLEVRGFVEDLADALGRCRVTVAPLRFGAGVKGKVLSSLSHGVPCVVTALAVEGTSISPETHCLLGDTPESFAQAVVRLLTDEQRWKEISEAGLQLMESTYSLEVVRGSFLGVLRHLKVLGAEPDSCRTLPAASCPARSNGKASGNGNGEHSLRPLVLPICDGIDDLCVFDARTKEECLAFLGSPQARRFHEEALAAVRECIHSQRTTLPGYSITAGREVRFGLDFSAAEAFAQCDGDLSEELARSASWRESIVCSKTGLNNRQRAVALFLMDHLTGRTSDRRPRVYLQEQVTPFFAWAGQRLSNADVIGSEYLGPSVAGGAEVNGIRHEDVQQLSFADRSLDLIISQDVMEHVPDPERGFVEMARVLRPAGRLIMTIPFAAGDQTVPRAIVLPNGSVKHLLKPMYHSNPLEPENGSLVFADFGYDIFEALRSAGFSDAVMRFFWSRQLGHIGLPGQLMLIIARR